MMGGTLISFLGGLFYWWPKMFGRMYHERLGQLSAIIVFIGFNTTFFPQFVMGAKGMPRRYANYLPEYQTYHVLSTIGAYLLGIGLVIAAIALVWGLFRGQRAPANPWGSATLEWQCSSPPPHNNFDEPPAVSDPYAIHQFVYDPGQAAWVSREQKIADSESMIEHRAGKATTGH
jgi:cytochrome c oxidase subunit 1